MHEADLIARRGRKSDVSREREREEERPHQVKDVEVKRGQRVRLKTYHRMAIKWFKPIMIEGDTSM